MTRKHTQPGHAPTAHHLLFKLHNRLDASASPISTLSSFREILTRFLLTACVAGFPCTAFPADTQYQMNQKDRGLILPRRTGEVTLGPAWLNGNEQRKLETFWNLRYALTQNLEIARLGLRYRFLTTANSQFAISLQNYGIGYSVAQGSYHHTSINIQGKQHLNGNTAITFNAGYFKSDSHEKDGASSENRIKVSAIYKLNMPSALDIGYTYRNFSGFNSGTGNTLKAMFTMNIKQNWDMEIEYGRSDFNEAVDSVLFNESYTDLLSIRAKLRF